MALGFVSLTAGMGVGYLSIAAHPEDRLVPDVTIYTTLAIWIWYAAGLHMRLVAGWRGRLAAIFGVVGFSALGFLVGLAMLMLNGWHGFGD
jgi:ABC-type transport system involved in cytochrome c biogenesis permease subunit